MSEIIDTGLGWWANEDWLRNEAVSLGSIADPAGSMPVIPASPNSDPTAQQIVDNGLFYGSSGNVDAYIVAISGYPNVKLGGMYYSETMQMPNIISSAPFSIVEATYNRNTGVLRKQNIKTGSTDVLYPGYYFGTGTYAVINETMPDNIPRVNNRGELVAAYNAAPATTFYKLAPGYSICCFMRWINANQQEMVAPIITSTDTNYIPISIDGYTEAPGIVTGIEFGGMTFYVNILLGYTGTVSSSVPYQDITGIYPQGTNIDGLFRAIATLSQLRMTDPYANGGTSGPGGGDGTFDFTSTDIPVPGLPTIGAYNTGFIGLFRPSAAELGALAAFMWSGNFDVNNFIKIFANPMDCILGLHIVPTSGGHPYSGSAVLKVGNISTGLSMPRLTEQYYELDCGTIQVQPKWGAYLDYAPYSKLSLYLPYIGFVTISPDDCMDGSIRVVYHVDVLSGSVCVYVYCSSSKLPQGHTLYTYSGSCACECPVTEGQYANGFVGSIQGGVGLASGVLSGNIMAGIEDAANALVSMAKPEISRSGSFSGSAGLMGIQYPFLVLTIPRMCTPGQQNKYLGYPSFVTTPLSSVTGYAQVDVTHLEGMSATDEEVTELLGLLAEGVIF